MVSRQYSIVKKAKMNGKLQANVQSLGTGADWTSDVNGLQNKAFTKDSPILIFTRDTPAAETNPSQR